MAEPTGEVRELIDAGRIAGRVQALAGEIARVCPRGAGAPLVMVVLLKGAFVFAADLLRALHGQGLWPRVEFLTASSYGSGTESQGEVRLSGGISTPLQGRDVLLVDDILDTGRSLAAVRDVLLARGAQTVRTCVLLDKPSRRAVDVRADFVGFEIPNRFVVGYGVDWDERYRHLPYIGVVEGV